MKIDSEAVTKKVLSYKPINLNLKCPECGSHEIEHYVTGLNVCKKCGNAWWNEKEKALHNFKTHADRKGRR